MTEIDAANFKPQGKPTTEQVRAVWNQVANPSARSVADELVKRGFQISFRTVARYKDRDWSPIKPSAIPLSERGGMKGIAKEIKHALDPEVKGTGLQAAVAPEIEEKILTERIKRIAELKLKSRAELQELKEKTHAILSIIMMEEAIDRSQVMVLVPAETAKFLEATTEAASVKLVGGEGQPPDANDPRTIEGTATRIPENATSSAIKEFMAKSGRAVAA